MKNYKFRDVSDQICSIEKSSYQHRDAIWIGVDHGPCGPDGKRSRGVRMHLTRKQVKNLLPILQAFAESGELG